MKSFFKPFLILMIFLSYSFSLSAAEQSKKLLEPGWSFKGFLVNLIERNCKGDIKFTPKYVRPVIQ